MRKDELDLIKSLSPPPVLHGGCPAVAGIAEAVSEDDGGCMAFHSGKYEGLGVSQSHFDSVSNVDKLCEKRFYRECESSLGLRVAGCNISQSSAFVGSNREVRLRLVPPDVYAGSGRV